MKIEDLLQLTDDLESLGHDSMIETKFHKDYHSDTIDRIIAMSKRYRSRDGYWITGITNPMKMTSPPAEATDTVTIWLENGENERSVLFRPWNNTGQYPSRFDLPAGETFKWSFSVSVYKEWDYMDGEFCPDPIMKISGEELTDLWKLKNNSRSHPERILWLLNELELNITDKTCNKNKLNIIGRG